MKRCSNCNSEYDDNKIYCSNCGNLLETGKSSTTLKPKKSKKFVVVSILLTLSVAFNIVLGFIAAHLNEENERQYSRYTNLRRDYFELKDNYNFFDKYARILPDDGSGIYHRYGCEELNSDVNFWIYNIDLVDEKASPCQKCCGEKSNTDIDYNLWVR